MIRLLSPHRSASQCEGGVPPDLLALQWAHFEWGQPPNDRRTYERRVHATSNRGFSLELEQTDRDVFESIPIGERIRGILLFAECALTILDAVVRQKTTIERGGIPVARIIGFEIGRLTL